MKIPTKFNAAFLLPAISLILVGVPYVVHAGYNGDANISSQDQTGYSTSSPKAAASHAVSMAQEKIKDSFFPSFGGSAPEWAKRIEFTSEFNINKPTTLSVLTVQPIYQSQNGEDTVFTQLGYSRYSLFSEMRNTVNSGLGYRRLLNNGNILLGGSLFFDNEFDNSHRRVGFGAEAKVGPLDGFFNYYLGASDTRDLTATISEKVMDGYDFRLTSQVPYLPWAKLNTAYYHWDKINGPDNTNGYEVGGEFLLTPNLGFEVKRRDDNNNASTNSFMLRFQLADQKRPALFGGTGTYSKVAFEKRNLQGETLNKVRRENRVMVERTVRTAAVGGGTGFTLSVVRGN